MTPTIRPETAADHPAVRTVLERAFGQPQEAQLVDALRKGGYARVSLVAELAGQVVGHVLLSDLRIVTADGTVPALALAPLSVVPEHQRAGIGSQLARESLRIAKAEGHRIVIVLGHATYYPRFGFSPELALPLASPYAGPHFMALELVPGALKEVRGEVKYAPPFQMF
jgi:putative acetyltransferase